MLTPARLFNAVFLILLGVFAALLAIPGKAGFAECRAAQIGILWPEGTFWEIPPMLWPILSIVCLALATLSFKRTSAKAARIAPFVPTATVLLLAILDMAGPVHQGVRFIECVANG